MSSPEGDLYVGAISGTSMDGIDLALLDDASPPAIRASHTVAFDPELRQALADLALGTSENLDQLGWAHTVLGDAIGAAITQFLAELQVPVAAVRAIGSHGQTVRHRPTGPHPFSLQIGDPNRIAERTGIDTVADFRGRDIAAGGQGAPLVPPLRRGRRIRRVR
jgi:anhydro-N-acetylmuramic acid kinase